MKKLFVLSLFSFLSVSLLAQSDIKEILSTSTNFNKTCAKADAYFKAKHPNKNFKEISIGEHRDGHFVKYKRWQRFWKEHLNEDGTLGDISKYRNDPHIQKSSISNPYEFVPYTNISNTAFITGQISMGRTTSMAFHPTNPDIFYVGAAIGGIWKTEDGGQSYIPLGDQLPYLAVSAVVVNETNPDHIYIAVSDHVWYGPSGIGVFKSIDGGLTWSATPLTLNFTDNTRIYWMATDPNNECNIFVTTSNGLYKTTDGFVTVSQVNNFDCSELHFKPNDSNIIYLGTRNGSLYKSVDAGSSFNLVNDFGNSYIRLATTIQDPNLVFVSHGNMLHKSFDAADSFTETNNLPESNMVISFSPLNPSEILVGNFEIYRSTNQGSTFNVITNWTGGGGLPLVHVDQRNIFTNNIQNNLIYFCNDGGIYTYNVNTNNFTDLSNGLIITQFYDIATAQSDVNVISGGSQDNGSMYRNSAGIWDDLAPTGDGMMTEIDPTNENIIYWEYQNGAMRRYNGVSNTSISPTGQDGNGAWETPFRLDPNDPNRIVSGYDKVYLSNDRGDNWTAISGDLAGGTNMNHVAIAKSNGNRIYAIEGNSLFVKDVGSNTWVTKSTPSGQITDIEVDPLDMDKIFISFGGYSNNNKVFKSNDAGDTWDNISGSLPNVPVGAFEIYEDVDDAYFVGTDVGVYYMDYQLQDWVSYGNLPHSRVEDIEIQYSQQLLRVGTHGRGVFEASIDIIECQPGDEDADSDGVCDTYDLCPFIDDNLIGMSCDDGDPLTSGEMYSSNCQCENGMSNIVYCNAMGSNGTGSDYISRISLENIEHTSTQSGYSDFRQISTELKDDSTYTLTMELNFAFPPDLAYAWIDYNKNGIFETSEEIVMSTFNAQNISQGTFTVPHLSVFGATTMRVRNVYDPPGSSDPCNNYFGEVEDYTIVLVDSCPIDKTISKVVYDNTLPLDILTENSISLDSIIINSNAQMIFEAGQYIELNNGFCTKLNAEVDINIGGCTN